MKALLRSLLLRFGIFHKIFLLALFLTIVPLLAIGFFTWRSIHDTRQEVSAKTTAAINRRTMQALEMQATQIAAAVQDLLAKVERDLELLRDTPTDPARYREFFRLAHGTIRDADPAAVHSNLPLYKEIARVDAVGRERIRVDGNGLAGPSQLRDVSDPANTAYRVEDYFARTRRLREGAVYVSRLTGNYITRNRQLRDHATPEEALRSGAVHYDGVIRFATPVYREGRFDGLVTLALDHRHLMAFTRNLVPLGTELTNLPSYSSGNYAFMFDDEGWIITHPKLWDIRGVDSRGRWVAAYSPHTPVDRIEAGYMPFNLDSAGFVHENYPIVAHAVRAQGTGTVLTTNVGGTAKIMSYAPILYSTGDYARYGVFGGVTVGVEILGFSQSATFVEREIDAIMAVVGERLWVVLLMAVLITAVGSFLLSRGITRPLIEITDGVRDLARGDLEKRLTVRGRDEVAILASGFNNMADELRKSRTRLLSTIDQLRTAKTETERHAQELEYQIAILQGIQRISNLLGTTLNMNTILQLILENCIKSVGFDRAILYLTDEAGEYLECKETFGFQPENDRRARRSRYHLERFDCIETRVVKEGRIIFVEDFDHYPDATSFDHKIRRVARNRSFVYVPLKVRERVIGTLGADKLRSGNAISGSDIDSLQILANQASRVIENTRLYQEVVNERNFVEAIIRNMQNAVITVDRQGSITTMNAVARALLMPDSANGGGVEMAPESRELLDEVVGELFEQGRYRDYNRVFGEGGARRYLTIAGSVIRREGHTPAGLIVIEDVTERKTLDDQVRRLERLASLGRFGASIAHEIRNPLTGVSLFLDNLHDQLADKPGVAALVEKALAEIERLETLTHDILVYTHPEPGDRQATHINDIVENVLTFVSPQCERSGVVLSSRLTGGIAPVYLNADRLRQAVLNLVINAIQAMPDGGRLSVSTGQVRRLPTSVAAPRRGGAGGWVKIRVQDSGPGIPAGEREAIFEPFYSTKNRGTGLGLATTHSIISAQDGIINVGGKVGTGAVFTIYLPLMESLTAAERRATMERE